MPKKKRRAERVERRRELDKQELASELTRVRRLHDDVRARRLGYRLVQILVCPTFEPTHSWDIREGALDAGGKLAVYHAQGPAGTETFSPGYSQLACPSASIEGFLAKLSALRLILVAAPPTRTGRDGVTYELSLFSDLGAKCRIEWWCEHYPPEWTELVTLARGMIDTFTACPPIERTGSNS
jgi:hypothetical protein